MTSISGQNSRHRKPLEAFLREVAIKRACRPPLSKIVVHTSGKAEKSFFKETCQEKLPGIIPAGMLLTLQRWKQREGGKNLHRRCILTDIGGVTVDPGLDDGKAGEDFEVELLKKNLYEKLWHDYIERPAFEPADEPIDVKGIA